MENVRKHNIVKLVKHWSGRYGVELLIGKLEFEALTVFNENFVAIERNLVEYTGMPNPKYACLRVFWISQKLPYMISTIIT